jgi:ABC-type cobalamin/Fe3+-siderophores transport system ATPase subunit
MIHCTDLSIVLNSKKLLSIDVLFFEKGLIHIIQGENGCGKSTLFRCMTGWTKPDSGVCKIDGAWVYQPQQFHLFAPKVLDNFSDVELAKQMLVSLKAEAIINQSVKRLSGGERQKVALVRTLCENADVYLLDEPTSYMDESSRLLAYQLIKEQLLNRGKTVLMINHESIIEPFDSGKLYLFKEASLNIVNTW